MKIFKFVFDVLRYIVYILASIFMMDRLYKTVFPEKG